MASNPATRRNPSSRLRLSGWRKTAVLNTFLVLVLFVGLLSCLLSSIHRSGGLNRILILFNGNCRTSKQINILLHLGSNIMSTVILASSNFFMQVLTSPSRQEVDKAHASGRSLDIGVQSLLNFGQLRKRKLVSWALFVLSSLPLHLFANSVIFWIDDGHQDYTAIYASESFTQGGQYFSLGAALMPARETPLEDYLNPSSNISTIITRAAREAAGWERLDVEACKALYLPTVRGPIYDHGDVVMILQSDGWTTEGLWNFDPSQFQAAARYVPADQLNTLLSTQYAPGFPPDFLIRESTSKIIIDLQYSIFRTFNDAYNGDARFVDQILSDERKTFLRSSIPTAYEVQYCLSQPVASKCKVAASLPILLIVVVTTLIKLSQCAAVIITFRHETPLVTLGDAVQSFINKQDVWTEGYCTYGWRDFRSLATSHQEVIAAVNTINARRWKYTRHRWSSAVRVWLQAIYYSVMIAGLGVAAFLYSTVKLSSDSWIFGPGPTSPIIEAIPKGSVVIASLTANSPQIMLSICYLCFNTLFTRFLLACEWGSLSLAFSGLRVTEPKGHQRSTFWLQLPLSYSLPLIVLSTMLHWLVSSCIFLYAGQGEYYGSNDYDTYADMPGTFIAVAYSPQALRILLIVSPILISIPFLMSLFCWIPGNTTLVGSDSRAIAAGCHASHITEETDQLLPTSAYDDGGGVVIQKEHDKLSEKKLKWGVVPGVSIHDETEQEGIQVWHLAFQSEDVGVMEPVEGRWYA